jgi:hypothetical protein
MTDDERREAEYAEFSKALAKIPRQVPCYSNGAVCPWCGKLHGTVSFIEANVCTACDRSYLFGYPDWHEGKDPISYVNFPWKAWDAFGHSAEHIGNWEPNDQLKSIYFQQTEERIGIYADAATPN